jgi:hypothetical protein
MGLFDVGGDVGAVDSEFVVSTNMVRYVTFLGWGAVGAVDSEFVVSTSMVIE